MRTKFKCDRVVATIARAQLQFDVLHGKKLGVTAASHSARELMIKLFARLELPGWKWIKRAQL